MRTFQEHIIKLKSNFELLLKSSNDLVKFVSVDKWYDWNIQEAKIILYELNNTLILLKNLYDNLSFEDKPENYKTSIIFTLSRNFIEGVNSALYLLSYFGEDFKILRQELWAYHSEAKRLKTLKKIGSLNPKVSEKELEVKERKEDLITKLKANSFDDKDIKEILNSNDEQLYDKKKVYDIYEIDNFFLDAGSTHYSQFCHFLPLGITQMNLKKFETNSMERSEFVYSSLERVMAYHSLLLKNMAMFVNFKFDELSEFEITTYHNIFIGQGIRLNFRKFLNESETKLLLDYINEISLIGKFDEKMLKSYLIDITLYVREDNKVYFLDEVENGNYPFGLLFEDTFYQMGDIEIKDKEIINVCKPPAILPIANNS